MIFKTLIMIILFFPIHTFAGSYLICVNPNDIDDWKWAPPVSEKISKFLNKNNDFIFISPEGTWLNGDLDFNNYLHPVLQINEIDKKFNLNKVKIICEKLQEHCQELDPNYTNVFVKGYSIPIFTIGYLSFYYFEKSELNSTTCKNLYYDTFPNNGGLFLSPSSKIYRSQFRS